MGTITNQRPKCQTAEVSYLHATRSPVAIRIDRAGWPFPNKYFHTHIGSICFSLFFLVSIFPMESDKNIPSHYTREHKPVLGVFGVVLLL